MAISYKQLKDETLQGINKCMVEQQQYFTRVVNCILQLKKYKTRFTSETYYKKLHILQALLYHYNDEYEFFKNWYNREVKA